MFLTVVLNFFILKFMSVGNTADMQVTEKDFFEVIDILEKSYTSVAKNNYQATLIFDKNWANETVNAQATRDLTNSKIWRIKVSGGMARANGMTKDAFALVLCHELGHYMGGAPHTFLYDRWPSAEGQADYWATSKCLKHYFYELQSFNYTENSLVPQRAVNDCMSVYHNPLEQKMCIRSMIAAADFGNFLNLLSPKKVVVDFESFDPRVVRGTNFNDYPKPQCRYDTLYQGALCPISFTLMTSDTDANVASCTGYEVPGARPLCWFFPQ